MSSIRLLFPALLLCTLPACAQRPATHQNASQAMELFDIATFREKAVDGHLYFVRDRAKVHQWASPPRVYLESAAQPDSNFAAYKEYDYSSLALLVRGTLFYGFPVGKWQTYNDEGKLVREVDEDAAYPFSIYDLDKKMKEQGIEIMRQNRDITVTRTENPQPTYTVSYPASKTDDSKATYLVIDARTGRTLHTETVEKEH